MSPKNISIRELTSALATAPAAPLKFYFDGSPINPGYHVTEVRHAAINSMDCGKGSDQWQEITIQLLDGSAASTEGHMPASKFLGIVGTALKSLTADAVPLLFFEFAPGNGPIRKLSVEAIEQDSNEISVRLGSERAVCKPLQRSKIARAAVALVGTGAAATAATKGCCSKAAQPEAGAAQPAASACCG